MADINSINVTGRITADFELRHTTSGTAVCDIPVAINSGWGDKQKTIFIDVTVWGKTGESCSQHLGKGSPIGVTGRLDFEQWDGKDGERRKKYKITADNVSFLPRQKNGGDGQQTQHEDPDIDDGPVPF